MTERRLPVRPDLDQLRRRAKELLRAIRRGDPEAVAALREHHPTPPDPGEARLHDAQLAIARAYGAPSWPRVVRSCRLIDAIWQDDPDTIRDLIDQDPSLLHQNAGIGNRNWGPPLSYAANLGRDRIIRLLRELGATDLEKALDRAVLQGKLETAAMLHGWLGKPVPGRDVLDGPAYTLSVGGTEFALRAGARVVDDEGGRLAPVDVVLETDSRNPEAKHRILELYVEHGLELPATPTMALHRGRIDLLEDHLERGPDLLTRTFTHEEIYPPGLGCHDEVNATQGTPLKGATLLHLCADYDELEIAHWLIERGADVNVRADVDEDGFGGHTPLFGTVLSQPAYWANRRPEPDTAPFTRLFLEQGADPNVRASLRKRLHPGYGRDEVLREFRDVTPLSWGRRYHRQEFVSQEALRLIEGAGGRE